MRIENLPQKDTFKGIGTLEKEPRLASKERQPKFIEELQKVQGAHLKERLENLIKKIDEQGKKLSESMTMKELKVYKELVRSFLKETVGKSYQAKEDTHMNRRGRHKVYTIVEQVDQKLEELATVVMEQQSGKIDVLAKLDEIKGLLLDTYT